MSRIWNSQLPFRLRLLEIRTNRLSSKLLAKRSQKCPYGDGEGDNLNNFRKPEGDSERVFHSLAAPRLNFGVAKLDISSQSGGMTTTESSSVVASVALLRCCLLADTEAIEGQSANGLWLDAAPSKDKFCLLSISATLPAGLAIVKSLLEVLSCPLNGVDSGVLLRKASLFIRGNLLERMWKSARI